MSSSTTASVSSGIHFGGYTLPKRSKTGQKGYTLPIRTKNYQRSNSEERIGPMVAPLFLRNSTPSRDLIKIPNHREAKKISLKGKVLQTTDFRHFHLLIGHENSDKSADKIYHFDYNSSDTEEEIPDPWINFPY